jgi:ribonuclease HII
VDEVGRGSLAGSVVAAAYRFHRSGTLVSGLDDSKKLSLKKREELFTLLTRPETGIWAIGEATIEEIEEYNILVASQMAMGRALDKLGLTDGVVLVDGLPAKHLGRKHIAVVGGDGICPSIAAASIRLTHSWLVAARPPLSPPRLAVHMSSVPSGEKRGARAAPCVVRRAGAPPADGSTKMSVRP